MLGDNIKLLRKNNGLTQEELAIRLNVVRQTISKWEKGFSVPDAEMLQKMAEVLDVDIKQLLGGDIDLEKNNNEVVEQLARINEQLIIKNKRARLIWKIVGIVLGIFVVLNILAMVLSFAAFSAYESNTTVETEFIKEDMNNEEIMVEP